MDVWEVNTRLSSFVQMCSEDARAFLVVHHAAVRGVAAKDYPLAVIEAWAPMPITEDAIDRVRANPDNEYRVISEIDGRVVGIGAAVFDTAELRACYVTPDAGEKGVGSALVEEIERAARERGVAHLELDLSLTPSLSTELRAMRWSNGLSTSCTMDSGWPV